ncbi:MAG TPA: hypothetical protein VKE94_17865 [Gemmataceae bacterium]|nr:hypothetical protein [Gemmataceae bacterium]
MPDRELSPADKSWLRSSGETGVAETAERSLAQADGEAGRPKEELDHVQALGHTLTTAGGGSR